MNSDDINQAKIMQLATALDDQPWVCSVYFVVHEGCFYWLSFSTRRHSKELKANPRAAITIAVKADQPVIGLQAEGDVAVVHDLREVTPVIAAYIKKYGVGKSFIKRFVAGINQHALYRLTPRRIMLFDEHTNSNDPYREITLK